MKIKTKHVKRPPAGRELRCFTNRPNCVWSSWLFDQAWRPFPSSLRFVFMYSPKVEFLESTYGCQSHTVKTNRLWSVWRDSLWGQSRVSGSYVSSQCERFYPNRKQIFVFHCFLLCGWVAVEAEIDICWWVQLQCGESARNRISACIYVLEYSLAKVFIGHASCGAHGSQRLLLVFEILIILRY